MFGPSNLASQSNPAKTSPPLFGRRTSTFRLLPPVTSFHPSRTTKYFLPTYLLCAKKLALSTVLQRRCRTFISLFLSPTVCSRGGHAYCHANASPLVSNSRCLIHKNIAVQSNYDISSMIPGELRHQPTNHTPSNMTGPWSEIKVSEYDVADPILHQDSDVVVGGPKSCGAKVVVGSDAVAKPCSAHTFAKVLSSTRSQYGRDVETQAEGTSSKRAPSQAVSGRANGRRGGKLASTKPGRACPCGPPRLKRWSESTLQSGLLATTGCRSSSGSERLRRGSAIGSLTWPSGAREGRRLYLEGGGPGCRSVPTVGRGRGCGRVAHGRRRGLETEGTLAWCERCGVTVCRLYEGRGNWS